MHTRKCGRTNVFWKLLNPLALITNMLLHSNGAPRSNQSYDINIRKLCKKAGMREISVHILRHIFATRCIESGMRPKTLQMILGHANISMTMDRYVHVTDDEKTKELENIEAGLKVI